MHIIKKRNAYLNNYNSAIWCKIERRIEQVKILQVNATQMNTSPAKPSQANRSQISVSLERMNKTKAITIATNLHAKN